MATVEETLRNAQTPLAQALHMGVADISYDQEVTFVLYKRLVLPLDGYLFWVRADRLPRGSAQLNDSQLNTVELNETGGDEGLPFEFKVKGSLHIQAVATVEAEQVYAAGTVIFTSLAEVTNFWDVSPDSTYIGFFEGKRFSFGSQNSFYRQANLYHYIGTTLNSFMATQVVDDPATLATAELIVSNSLPAWLAINRYDPPWPVPMPFPAIPLWPSFLPEQNFPPPYGTIHIAPDNTEGLQMTPFLGRRMEHSQLAKDRVTVTLYGCTNAVALDWLDCLLQYSYDTERFGLMSWPTAVIDDKQFQSDFSILSQRKRLVFEVSYNQATIRDIARQMIEEINPPTQVIGLEDAPVVISPA